MTIIKPEVGDPDWGPVLNTALDVMAASVAGALTPIIPSISYIILTPPTAVTGTNYPVMTLTDGYLDNGTLDGYVTAASYNDGVHTFLTLSLEAGLYELQMSYTVNFETSARFQWMFRVSHKHPGINTLNKYELPLYKSIADPQAVQIQGYISVMSVALGGTFLVLELEGIADFEQMTLFIIKVA